MIMKKNNVLLALLSLWLVPAAAQQTKTLSLDQCIEIASENSLGVKVAEKGVERAKALQGTAWDLDKTELSLGQDPTSGGSPDNALSISQSIEFPTLYIARRKQLKAETKAEQSRALMTRRRLQLDIASLYWKIAYQQTCLGIFGQQDSLLARYADVSAKRYKAGDSRQLEYLSAQKMAAENLQELSAARNELEAMQREMAALMNVDYLVVPKEDSLRMMKWSDKGFNFMQTAEGQYSQDLLAVAERSVSVARNGYAPSLSLSLRNQLVISSWNPYSVDRSKFSGGNFMGFEVGVGIPLFFGATKAKVKAAKKDREIAEMEMRQTEALRRSEYSSCVAKVRAAQQKTDFYNGRGYETACNMLRLGKLEYESGDIPYTEYVGILQNYSDTMLKRAAAINEYNQAVVALMRVTDSF